MTDLSPDARHALRLARRAAEPGAEQLERVGRRLRASLEGGEASHPHERADMPGQVRGSEMLQPADAATRSATALAKLTTLAKSLTLIVSALGVGTLATWICLRLAAPAPVAPIQDRARAVVPVPSNPGVLRAPVVTQGSRSGEAALGSVPGSEGMEGAGVFTGDEGPAPDAAAALPASRVKRGRRHREHETVAPRASAGAAPEPPPVQNADLPEPASERPVERTTAAPAAEPPVRNLDHRGAARGPYEATAGARREQARVVAATPSTHAEAPTNESLAEEIPVIARAHALLKADRAGRALALLERYFQKFPHGTLHAEARATRALCYCQLEAKDKARAAVRELAADPAAAPHLARVRTACRALLEDADM